MCNIKSFLANLTTEPGVYRMLNASDEVLYVGKASNLKKRVSSYFNKTRQSVKTEALLKQVADIKVSITRSETEALLLESNLIKSLRPKYNILLRDDKSYPYIYLSTNHPYPRMDMLRSKQKPKKGDFFGPYPSVYAVKDTLNFIQKVFKIRNCKDSYFSHRTRPCLQYQIKRCTAPCTGYISEKEYQQNIQNAKRLLQGKCDDILRSLESRMEVAVDNLQFEEAARMRDQIKSLRAVQEQQGIVQLRGDADAIAIEVRPGFACIQCVTIREGQILVNQTFFPKMPIQALEEPEQLWQAVFSAFIAHYYIETPERIPALILIAEPINNQAALETMLSQLRQKNCRIQINPRGIKARWLDFAANNLQIALQNHQRSQDLMKARFYSLQQFLGLPSPIERMECVDVSHTHGEATKASCVVFDAGGPLTSAYRQFDITGITPGDDYKAMEQILTRRYKRLLTHQQLPDILIIDGGKGQVAVARRVFESLGIDNVKLLGIAKGPTRKAGWEQLIIADENKEKSLPSESQALHLLQHIRDEAHRFAISAHRKKRQNSSLESSLQSIEGIGVKRRQALMRRFGGMRELAKASIEEIGKVPGISLALARRIYQTVRKTSSF